MTKVICIISRRCPRYAGRRIDPSVGSTRGHYIASNGGIEGIKDITGANAEGSAEITDGGFRLYLYAHCECISHTAIRSRCDAVIDVLIGVERVS